MKLARLISAVSMVVAANTAFAEESPLECRVNTRMVDACPPGPWECASPPIKTTRIVCSIITDNTRIIELSLNRGHCFSSITDPDKGYDFGDEIEFDADGCNLLEYNIKTADGSWISTVR